MSIRIRLVRDGDVDAMVEIYRPIVEHTMTSFEIVPPDRAEMTRRVQETVVSYPWLVCEIDGRVAGYAYATKHRLRTAYQWSVDTSVYVAERSRGRGVGRGLYESLFAVLAAQGYVNAYAGIALPNPASVALHEAVGFERVGIYRGVGYKLGRWWDVGWWERGLRTHDESPVAPTDMASSVVRPDWDLLETCGESSVRPARSS